jgi:plasmid replication initiation protein
MTKKLKMKQSDFIVKNNNLVEARYRLSLQESQVILWLLTQIRPDDEDFKSHKLDIIDFAKIIDVHVDSKYHELRKVTKRLMQRVMEIQDISEDRIIQVSWLSSAIYELKKGFISLEFSPALKPYLLQLKSHFTKINIADTLKLKSIYAIRIFELLLQYQSIGSRKMTVEELRAYCGIEKKEYKLLADFKRKVIERAKTEINNKTEYYIDYTEIKESRKIVAIEWTIKKKDLEQKNLQDRIENLEKELSQKSNFVADLTAYGFSKSLANKLVKENDEPVIKNALLAVSIQQSRDQVKNPKAMLKTAIKEKWHPQIFKNRA